MTAHIAAVPLAGILVFGFCYAAGLAVLGFCFEIRKAVKKTKQEKQ